MNNVINLGRFRKKKKRAAREADAAGNRQKFGRTKSEKANDASDKEKITRHVDGHKRDDDGSG